VGPRAFWASVVALILGVDLVLARGEADGDTFCEVAYSDLHLDEPAPRAVLALGMAALWLHLIKRRPWLDNPKE
jgi:hypothetical protein